MTAPNFRYDLLGYPSNEDFIWVVAGWAVVYSTLKWLRTDGSDHSVRVFDDGWWPDAVLIGWPTVYWVVSRILHSILVF
jgi:hypothetical protein